MLPFEDRYSRQRRLPEVGGRGQLALQQAHPSLHTHAGSTVEQDYLRRSGIVSFAAEETTPPPVFLHACYFEFTGPLHVAQGACQALAVIRETLKVSVQSADLQTADISPSTSATEAP